MNLEKKVIYGKPKDCYFLPFNINEAMAWKGTAMSRKQLFKEGLVVELQQKQYLFQSVES